MHLFAIIHPSLIHHTCRTNNNLLIKIRFMQHGFPWIHPTNGQFGKLTHWLPCNKYMLKSWRGNPFKLFINFSYDVQNTDKTLRIHTTLLSARITFMLCSLFSVKFSLPDMRPCDRSSPCVIPPAWQADWAAYQLSSCLLPHTPGLIKKMWPEIQFLSADFFVW